MGFLDSNFTSEHWDFTQQSFKIQYLLPWDYHLKCIDPGAHSKLVCWLISLRILTTLFDNKLHQTGDLKTKLIQSRASAKCVTTLYFPCETSLKDWTDSTDHICNHRISLGNRAGFLASNSSIPKQDVTLSLKHREMCSLLASLAQQLLLCLELTFSTVGAEKLQLSY